nr:JNK Rab-associated protein-1 domain containing protein [Haemonchus contortus]
MGNDKFELMQNMPLPQAQLRTRMGMAASVDASSIRGVSDLISAHMSQSTTMDVNLANHISNEADWQDEFSSDVEPSPRDMTSEEEKAAPSTASENTPKNAKGSERDEEESEEQRDGEDSLGADLTDIENGDDSRQTSRHQQRSISLESESGMGREVENLIKENMELLDMKNALNIVKNDLIARVDELSSENAILRDEVHSFEMVRVKMSDNITKLEEELKSVKQKLAEKEAEEEEEVPLAQRKRFTRMEMQRVLIDRNMYKERLMELEESLKWTEMQRARKLQAQAPPPKKGGIWDFFSGLFGDLSPPTQPRRSGLRADARGKSQMTRSVEYLDPEMISERRAAERREQYKLVREHVKRDDSGRIEAYGWSLPAVLDKSNASTMVPVPVCCRPLMENQPSVKVWCATSVILRGGLDKDGKFITGNPVYLSPSAAKVPKGANSDDQLENEISHARALDARESELTEWQTSSIIWVGSSNQGKSHVAVLDANNPNNVIETFRACESHLLCIRGVPGVSEGDPSIDDAGAKAFLCGGGKVKDVPDGIEFSDLGACEWVELRKMEDCEDGVPTYCSNDMRPSPKRTRDYDVEPQRPSGSRVGRAALPSHVREAMNKYDESVTDIPTGWPTVWMGSQNQYIYIHSAVVSWKRCLRRIKMPDAVLSIIHYKGRVFAALANGTLAVFHRSKGGEWADFGYHTIRVGPATSSVRCLCIVASNIWAAYKNCIVVVDGESLQIVKVFAAHPRRDSQVRAVQWVGAGVWISIRLDSTLRMYHAHTFEHLQDVDIEPYVTKMLGTSRLDFSYMRTTALHISNRRLWIGTGTGVVISVPLSGSLEQKVETNDGKKSSNGPGGLVRVYSSNKDSKDDASSSGSGGGAFIPYCNLTQAQLSFHGHKDSVKFFLAVPGAPREVEDEQEAELRKMLVISGGDGYIDFRLGEENEPPMTTKGVRARDMSHIIIWEVDAELPVISS